MTVETMLRMLSAAAVQATIADRMIRFVRIGDAPCEARSQVPSGPLHAPSPPLGQWTMTRRSRWLDPRQYFRLSLGQMTVAFTV